MNPSFGSAGLSAGAGCAAAGGCAGVCAGGVWAKTAAGSRARARALVESSRRGDAFNLLLRTSVAKTLSLPHGHTRIQTKTAMISLASSMPSRVSRSRGPSRTSRPPSTIRDELRAEALPDVDAVTPADGVDVEPVGQPQAREQRLLEPLRRRQAPSLARPRTARRRCGGCSPPSRRRSSTGRRPIVECAPQPNAEPLAVLPVFEVVPRLAARARDVRDLVLPVAGRVQPLQAPQIHLRRVVVGRQRPARRAPSPPSAARSDRARADRATRAPGPRQSAPRRSPASRSRDCCGSHIIRSRLTLSNPAPRASPTACARAIGRMNAAQPLQLRSRNDWTPKLMRLTPAARNRSIRSATTSRGWSRA